MAYKISDECIKCGACAGSCPVSCITEGDNQYVIDEENVSNVVLVQEYVQLEHQN